MNPAEEPESTSQDPQTDWRDVLGRVEGAWKGLEAGWGANPEARDRVLRDRAASLARQTRPESGAASLEVVVFRVAGETYGVESAHVREVYPLKDLTPVPCTPPFVLGITNVRGQILSVIDIKKLFDLPEQGITDLNRVVVLQSEHMAFGILADTILGARRVPVAELQPSLPTLTEVREQYLKGVTEDRLVVLDAEALLSDRSLVVHEEAEA